MHRDNKKWTAKTSFVESQIEEMNVNKTMEIKYKLIDINKYEVEELLEENTLLANAMILEKCKNNEEVLTSIKMIAQNQKYDKKIHKLKRLVVYLYADIEQEKLKEILNLIEESESEEKMSTIAERLKKEFHNERKEGRKEGMKEGMQKGIQEALGSIIKNMLQLNQDDKTIMKFTNAKKEDIEKVKINLGMLAK